MSLAVLVLLALGIQGLAARFIVLRDWVFRGLGVIVALLTSSGAASSVERILSERLMAGPLEGISTAAAWTTGLLALAILGAGAYWLPDLLLRAQLLGRIKPASAGEALWVGNLCSALALVVSMFFGVSALETTEIPVLSLTVFAGFGVPRLMLDKPRASHGTPLWIVLPFTPALASTRRFLRRLTAAWKHGPVSWVAPAQAAPFVYGAHSQLADRLGRLKALFPELKIECADWHRVLPPATAWDAVPVRELYPASNVMADAIAALLPVDARVVVVTGAELPARPFAIKLKELAATLRQTVPISHTQVWCLLEADIKEAEAAFPGLARKIQQSTWSTREARKFLETLWGGGLTRLPVRTVTVGHERQHVEGTGGSPGKPWAPRLTWPLSSVAIAWTVAAAVVTTLISVGLLEGPLVRGVSRQQLLELRLKTDSALQTANVAVATAQDAAMSAAEAQRTADAAQACCNEVNDKMDRSFFKGMQR